MRVRWTSRARCALLTYLREVAENDRGRSRSARIDIQCATGLLARFPYAGRVSLRWPGSRERSLPSWSKLIVYELQEREIVITLFLDTRQDLDKVRINPE